MCNFVANYESRMLTYPFGKTVAILFLPWAAMAAAVAADDGKCGGVYPDYGTQPEKRRARTVCEQPGRHSLGGRSGVY